jgi:[acyl-carrier-protein] S-malonyltransferase
MGVEEIGALHIDIEKGPLTSSQRPPRWCSTILRTMSTCTSEKPRPASYTRCVAGAAQRFAVHQAGEPFVDPSCRLTTHHSGRVRCADATRQPLAAQLAATVVWDDCMDALLQTRVDAVPEIGAGCALTRLLQHRVQDLPVRAVDDCRSLPVVRKWLRRHCDPVSFMRLTD